MSLSKNLIPSDDAQTVRATGKGVIEIDLLPPKVVKNCRFLYVSYNSISNLQNITQFRFMQSLMIEYNLIETIDALYPLAQLTKLRTIRLEGNPVCFLPLWELQLIKICPQIVYINGMDVNTILKSKESRIKLDYLELERNFIQVIYLAEYVCKSIEIVLQHPEMSFTDSNNLVDLPPEEEFSQQVRKRCKNARPNQYMGQLKEIIVETHKRVQELSNSCPGIPKTSIRQHRKVLATASQKNSVPQFTEAVEPLSSAALFLVGIGDGVQLSPDDCMSVTSQMSRKSIVSTASTASTSSRARSVLKGVKKVNDSQKKRPSGSTANSQIKDEENINNNTNGEFEDDLNNTYNDENMQNYDDQYDENGQKLNKNLNEGEEEEFNEEQLNNMKNDHTSDINNSINQQNSLNNNEISQNEEEDNLDSVDENDQDKNQDQQNEINEEGENYGENTNKDNENLEEGENYGDDVDEISGSHKNNDVNSKISGSISKNSQNGEGKLHSYDQNFGMNGNSDENDEDIDQINNLSQENKLNDDKPGANDKISGMNGISGENDEEKGKLFDNLQQNELIGNKYANNGNNGINGQENEENQSDYDISENDPNQSLGKEEKLGKNGQIMYDEYNDDDNLLNGAHSKQNQNEEEEENILGEDNDENIDNKRKSHYYDEEEDLYNDNPTYSKDDELNSDSNEHRKSSLNSFELEELRAQQEAEENGYEEEDFNFEKVEKPKYDGSKRNIRKYVDSAEQVTIPLLTSFTQTPSFYNSRASQISQPTNSIASQTNTTPIKASDIRQIESVSDDEDDNDKLFEIVDEIGNEKMSDDDEIKKYNDLKNDAFRIIQMSGEEEEEEEINTKFNQNKNCLYKSGKGEINPKSNKPGQNKNGLGISGEDEINPKSNKPGQNKNGLGMSGEEELNPKYKKFGQNKNSLGITDEDEIKPKSNQDNNGLGIYGENEEINPKFNQNKNGLGMSVENQMNPRSNKLNQNKNGLGISGEDEMNPKSKKPVQNKNGLGITDEDEIKPKSKKPGQNKNGLEKSDEGEEINPKFNQNNNGLGIYGEDEEGLNPKSKKPGQNKNGFGITDEDEIKPKSNQNKNGLGIYGEDEMNPKSKKPGQNKNGLLKSDEGEEINPQSNQNKHGLAMSGKDEEGLNPKSKKFNQNNNGLGVSREDEEMNPKSNKLNQNKSGLGMFGEDQINPKSKKPGQNKNSLQKSDEDEMNPKSNKNKNDLGMSDEDQINPKYKKSNQNKNGLQKSDEDDMNPKSKKLGQNKNGLGKSGEDELNPKYKKLGQNKNGLQKSDEDEMNPKSNKLNQNNNDLGNYGEDEEEMNPKSKKSGQNKNGLGISGEGEEMNPKSKKPGQNKNGLGITEQDELKPKSNQYKNGLGIYGGEEMNPKSKKSSRNKNDLGMSDEDEMNPKSKSNIEHQNEEDINSISPQSSQIKEENEQKNTPENRSGKKVILSDASPQYRTTFSIGRSKNKKENPKVNFDSDDLNNNKLLENEKSLQTSEFKINEENSPNESDILLNVKGNKASPHTSDILFNDDIESKENNNEIEDVQINNVIDSLTPLNSDVLRHIEHLDPAPNSSDDGDKKNDLSVVELAKTIEQKELTDSETKISSNSFDEDNKLLQEFASTEPLMNSAARFGEPSSPIAIKNDMNKPETNISLLAHKKVNIEKAEQKTKNDDEKVALSDIRNITDGSNFDASLGTSDNGRRRPKSILKTSSTSILVKDNTKRITFVPQNNSETMSGENYSGVEPVLILRNVVKNYDLIDKFFSRWKGEYRKRTIQMSTVISDIQTQAHSAIIEERKSKTFSIMPISSIQSNFSTIRQIAIKHELIRKIDVQRDINEKMRERYEQAKRELAARQSSKPIQQSPMFNRSSKQTRVDEEVINFSVSTRVSVRQSKSTKLRTSLTTSGNPQGRITHMDILRLQMGM